MSPACLLVPSHIHHYQFKGHMFKPRLAKATIFHNVKSLERLTAHMVKESHQLLQGLRPKVRELER